MKIEASLPKKTELIYTDWWDNKHYQTKKRFYIVTSIGLIKSYTYKEYIFGTKFK